jgi:hypothetical protein
MEKTYSENYQDLFVLYLLNKKTKGIYVDIGSNDGIHHNNTFLLEKYDWNGICIELSSDFNETYKDRKCLYLNKNALDVDYLKLFVDQKFSNIIDYLSLDIDEKSTEVLKILPFDQFKFKIITIEHDGYSHGDKYRKNQRQILKNNGYELLFGNVFAENFNGIVTDEIISKNGKLPYEDWWVNPLYFDKSVLELKQENILPSEIIIKLMNKVM